MKLDTYSKHAYVYSAWTAVTIPCILTFWYIYSLDISLWSQWSTFIRIIGIFTPTAIVFAGVGFFIRNLFRNTSKMLIQFPLFKENETEMPTTQFLLHTNSELSDEQKLKIRSKVLTDFDYIMPSIKSEKSNIQNAKLNIVDAVGKMRSVTREDKILRQYNYRFGFCRNLLGGLIWGIVFSVSMVFINLMHYSISYWVIGVLTIIEITIGFLSFVFLKFEARTYARNLFNTYLTTRVVLK